MEIDDWGNKRWKNSKGQYHRTGGPAVEYLSGDKSWYVNGEWLGYDDEGFWALWDRLTTKQKQDSILLSYLPEKF
jgi:hypothetical protein